MRDLKALSLMLVWAIGCAAQTAVWSQNPTQDNQPIRGELHAREVALKNRVQAAFKAGRIDSTILAKMQRDLDGICVKEEEFRAKQDGISEKDRADIIKKLDVFEQQLKERETQ